MYNREGQERILEKVNGQSRSGPKSPISIKAKTQPEPQNNGQGRASAVPHNGVKAPGVGVGQRAIVATKPVAAIRKGAWVAVDTAVKACDTDSVVGVSDRGDGVEVIDPTPEVPPQSSRGTPFRQFGWSYITGCGRCLSFSGALSS